MKKLLFPILFIVACQTTDPEQERLKREQQEIEQRMDSIQKAKTKVREQYDSVSVAQEQIEVFYDRMIRIQKAGGLSEEQAFEKMKAIDPEGAQLYLSTK